MNGRVNDVFNFKYNKNINISNLYNENNSNLETYKSEALKHLFYDTKTNIYFFSKQNIDLLQNTIMNEVELKTNIKINRQSDRELLIIMKSIYLQYSKNNDDNLENEIKYLNELVLESSIPSIISNLLQYVGYLKDISTPRCPMEKPKFTRSDPTLEYNRLF